MRLYCHNLRTQRPTEFLSLPCNRVVVGQGAVEDQSQEGTNAAPDGAPPTRGGYPRAQQSQQAQQAQQWAQPAQQAQRAVAAEPTDDPDVRFARRSRTARAEAGGGDRGGTEANTPTANTSNNRNSSFGGQRVAAAAWPRNYSYFPSSAQAHGTSVLTQFMKLRLDPKKLLVKTDDYTFANSRGRIM